MRSDLRDRTRFRFFPSRGSCSPGHHAGSRHALVDVADGYHWCRFRGSSPARDGLIPVQSMQTQEHWLTTSRGRIYVKQWRPGSSRPGREAPIVLLHDSLGCVQLWRDFPERLAQASARIVFAYDRLGFGRSEPHPGQLGTHFIHDEAGDTFRSIREQLGIDTFVAFGHSVGGGMAVGCAAVYSDACEALITEAAQAFVEDRTIEGVLKAKAVFQQPGQLERLAKYHGEKAAWVLRAWIDTWLDPAFATWTLDDDLRRVQCPTFVMHGTQDEYGSALHPERIAAHVNGLFALEMLKGCGHVPHRERTEDVLVLVQQWLERRVVIE